MSRYGLGRNATVSGLIGVATLGVVAVQQLAEAPAFAEPRPTGDYQDMRALPDLNPGVAQTMNAAVSTGQFEELVKPTPVPSVAPTPVPSVAPTPARSVAPKPVVFESGIASTYGEGDGFEGNRTACGQIFHTRLIQVAHKTLPCGTMIRVEDASTGRSVEAEVTDRGPYIPGRIVDLSWGAFRQLEPEAPGLLRVNVYLLDN